MTTKRGPLYLEFVCTSNNGRSPLAELIAHNRLEYRLSPEHKLKSPISVRSSGTDVMIQEARVTPSNLVAMKSVMAQALKHGQVYDGIDKHRAASFIQHTDPTYSPNEIESELYWKAIERFHADERKFRAYACQELGIPGTMKEKRDQFTPQSETAAVFGMENYHVGQIERTYDDLNVKKPLIAKLSSYARNASEAALPQAFGGTQEDYLSMAMALKEDTEGAVDQFIMRHQSSLFA